ncbi:MAG: metallophosphoesterase [Alistipes sp.]|nr:metallophosphoesterase [Alistipes sp.]
MKIQYASDLHLEFAENSSHLKNNPLNVVGEVLVLAGDIGYIGDDNYSKHPFWDWISENYKEVIVIPGNHEFYKMFDLNKLYNGWTLEIRKNVKCYYNAVIPLREDIELVATTLWAYIPFQDAFRTESAISDFRRIRSGSEPLDFNRFNEEHYRCFNFLKEAVAKSNAKHIIVATHHVPSFVLIAPEYKGSPLNGAFTVELGDYIASSRIEYWIYGHSHRNIDKVIGNTKCISNQLGYVFHNEHTLFDDSKHIEIEQHNL